MPRLHAPTLILNGRRDTLVPFRLAEEVHASIPGAKRLGFDGGHLFLRSRERAGFFAAVEGFVRVGS